MYSRISESSHLLDDSRVGNNARLSAVDAMPCELVIAELGGKALHIFKERIAKKRMEKQERLAMNKRYVQLLTLGQRY